MSQSILPGNFSVNGLSVIERRRLEYYYEQYVLRRSWIYGEGHFILACYAALPVVLTPDLLHKLWLNFKNYRSEDKYTVIHPVAPADLLLSPLVEEIGHELYEMPESIRQVLLLHLKEITARPATNPQQLYSLTEIAQFLHTYAQYDFTPANKNDEAFREAQIWTAMSYLDPGQAFAQLVNKYKQAKDKSPDQLRYANALGNMSRRFTLDIVLDPALVPKAHKAVTALTSVVKDVINDRDPARLAELQREIQNSSDEVLTDVPVVKENVINIEIDELVTAKLGKPQKKKGKGILRALVVGVMRPLEWGNLVTMVANRESAELIANLLSDETIGIASGLDLKLLMEHNATKHAILNNWKEILEVAATDDDLLFYLAGEAIDKDGHCYVACADSDNSSIKTWLLDQEIGALTDSKQVASVTMIIQADHAATEYWLDTTKGGNIIYAASKYEQQPLQYSLNPRTSSYVCGFTVSLVKVLRESKMQTTNRNLFVKILQNYADELHLSDNDRVNIIKDHSPVLLCNANTRDQFFCQGKNKLVQLQTLLRDTGFYNKKITGEWDSYTAFSLGRYIQEVDASVNFSKQRYIEMLLEQRRLRFNDQPIFLFIVSDSEKKLINVARERSGIRNALSDLELNNIIQVCQLHISESEEIMTFFSAPQNRNRIQLVYYSGFDESGDFLLGNHIFMLTEFASLLEYQQNIQLFVSNTCRSENFAEYVSMLGMPQSIGVKGEITDEECADFGIELFKTIVGGGQLDEVRNLGRSYISRENGFILYKKDPAAVLPWKFREDPEKINVFISYAFSDRELVYTLINGVRTMLPKVEINNVDEIIAPGEDWGRKIMEVLSASDIVLACISPGYLNSEHCMEELRSSQQQLNKQVICMPFYQVGFNEIPEFSRLTVFGNHGEVFADIISDNKNIALNEEFRRYLESLGEVIERSLLKRKTATVYVAQNEFPSFEGAIIGREDLLLQIDEQLYTKRIVLLSGTIGMGKTTAAIAYCRNLIYMSGYKHVIWVDGSEDILYGIIEVLGRFLNESIHDRHSILTKLDSLPGKNLLVIDNANGPMKLSEFMEAFAEHKMETNCLVISRCNLYEDRTRSIEVGPLSLADAGLLYRQYNQKSFQEETFKSIYKYIDGNVLLIAMLAKFANNLSDTSQLLHFLQVRTTSLFDHLQLAGLTRSVYNSVKLDKDLEDLMRPLSLFPARELPLQLFFALLGGWQTVNIEVLILAGWMEQVEENYKIQFIVKEIFRSQLSPDAENCFQLITRLRDLLDEQNAENKSDLLTIGISVINEIGLSPSKEAWVELGKLQLLMGKQLRDEERFAESLLVIMRPFDLFSDKFQPIDHRIDALQLAAELFHIQGKLDNSLEVYYECHRLLQEQIDSSDDSDLYRDRLIEVILGMVQLHREGKNFQNALGECKDAARFANYLFESGYDSPRKLLAKCYVALAYVYQDMGDLENAIEYFERSRSILEGNVVRSKARLNSISDDILKAQNPPDEAVTRKDDLLSEELVSEQKSENEALSGLQLKMPPGTYLPWNGSTNIIVNTEKQQAFLVDRTLVCFAADITEQQRIDVLDLLLLAQLSARKDYPEMEQAMDWHRSFKNVLTNIGCTIEERGFSQFGFPGKTFRLENPIMNMMANASVKYNLKKFLEKSLVAFRRLPDGIGRAFEKNTHSSNNGAFQVCLVANSNEVLELNLGMMVLISDSPIIDLFGVWSTENARLDYTTLSCKVNERLYADVRDVVSEKLIYISVRYVMEI